MGLVDLLPENYKNCAQVVELQGAFEQWTDALRAARGDLLLQLNVNSASWGLDIWERTLGLKTDITKPYDYRRSRILSKLRGTGITTKKMIENVAESFSNGDVIILEYNEEYRFEVKFVGTLGIPPNMEDLTAAIEEIKPAHLEYVFVYVFRTHAELAVYTQAQMASYTHEKLRSGELI